MQSRSWGLGLALLVLVVPLVLMWAQRGASHAHASVGMAPEQHQVAAANDTARAENAGLTGTASCSMRGCHGGLAARTAEPIYHNELATWLYQDKHARAYEVLLGERSQQIAGRLKLKLAHEEPRCLACHTNPLAAEGVSQFLKDERLGGVGCEACHGGAVNWLSDHTSQGWTTRSAQQKAERGMTWTGDLAVRTGVCAGCHVGSPPGENFPARDVDHDLIAAGHPRLNFELGAFMARMPAHWKPEKERDWQAETWAVGQVVTAEKALELLQYRANQERPLPQKPWPEFAEYDCFACHHDLRQPSWRQTIGYGNRKPGTLPWGSWIWPMTLALAGQERNQGVLEAATQLRHTMESPDPNRSRVRGDAKALAERLRGWEEKLTTKKYSPRELRDLFGTFASEGPIISGAGWDAATQLYLALAALDAAVPDSTRHEAIQALYRALAFLLPLNNERALESPQDFTPAQADGKEVKAALARILETIK